MAKDHERKKRKKDRKQKKQRDGKREKLRSPPKGVPQCCPYLYYADPRRALEWLQRAFGFEERSVVPGPGDVVLHAELQLGKAVFMLSGAGSEPGTFSPRDLPGVSQLLYVYVEDVDAHCERARAAGAAIAAEPADMHWGDRIYAVRDCEGHHWTFAQHVGEAGDAVGD